VGLWFTQTKESFVHSGFSYCEHLLDETKQANKQKNKGTPHAASPALVKKPVGIPRYMLVL